MSENTVNRETEEERQERESVNAVAQYELDSSLEIPEEKRLAAYEAREAKYRRRYSVIQQLHERLQDENREATPQEQVYFDKWEQHRYTLILGIGEQADLKQLRARRDRPEQLKQYRQGLEADYMQSIDSHVAAMPILQRLHGRNWQIKYNLLGRIAKYEQAKVLEVLSPSDLLAYASEVIVQVKLELKELKSLAALRWPNDSKKAKIWQEVVVDVLKKFAQHVRKDSDNIVGLANPLPKLSETALTKNPALPTAPTSARLLAAPEPIGSVTQSVSTNSHASNGQSVGSSGQSKLISPWASLLIGSLSLTDFFDFFADCGLLTSEGVLTTLGEGRDGNKARKAPWAGTLQALIQSKQLDGNIAAICRALSDPAGSIGVTINEGTLRDYSGKAGNYLTTANEQLKSRGLLSK